MKFKNYLKENIANINNYINNTKFQIISWNNDSNLFKAIVNGKIRQFEFYDYEDHEDIINKIRNYYNKSKSVYKTLDYINKNFAKLSPLDDTNYKIKNKFDKFVQCDKCNQTMQISGNKPGSTCPNCGKGELKIYSD